MTSVPPVFEASLWHPVRTLPDLQEALGQGHTRLVVPSDVVGSMGPAWLAALVRQCPLPEPVCAVNDCADAFGYALASLNAGFGVVVSDPDPALRRTLSLWEIGAARGLPVFCRPGASGLPCSPDHP
ncbi:hypothetical protein IHV25_09635 [Phaeovibrio sulfidiphilus]|uniref:Uncharacterized protein n=1 Tax=Phaeovibrio sulfidiphilus TaxID=1220600 RepID=A0A8J6YN84_9PROT|nr:hypothetical protein [Phaeovibrio sulfidiphilus]MBE1237903.1 hypothetical protein [Phaeovibrio sulfidiphilus]